VLRAGGNAVDAAVAAAFTAFVAEPLLASAGGAGMMTIALTDRDPVVVDFFSTMPGLGARPTDLDFRAVTIDFGPTTQSFHVGPGSVAPPVALPGLIEATKRFGTLPLSELIVPAVTHARKGLCLSAENAQVYRLLWGIQQLSDEAVALAGGVMPTTASELRNPALADLLEEMARLGTTPPRFERALLDGFGPRSGGMVTAEDMARAAPRLGPPRAIEIDDWTVLASPHVGGSRVSRLLRALFSTDPHSDEAAEAARVAGACRAASVRGKPGGRGSTTHISVIDALDGAASVTLTNGEGCGFVVEGTGVQPNNFLGEDDLNPEGFHTHLPGVVLPTMIAPTIALRNGRPEMALGSGGSNRIRSVVSQVLYRVIRGDELEHAVMAPRVHAEGDDVWIENVEWSDFDAVERALAVDFERVNPFPKRAFYFGGVHAVRTDGRGHAEAVGDPRRGGAIAHVY